MSVTRRQFLLSTAGAAVGAIVPSFYYRALEFFERFEKPLLEPPERVSQDLVVADINGYPELCFGAPYAEPPSVSYREFFERYGDEGLANFQRYWRLPENLDASMSSDCLEELWLLHYGPSARAYRYLKSLDLGGALSGPSAVSGLDFLVEGNMGGSSWLAVRPHDEVSLSLLQQRLNDLGTGIRVVF